ncbi:hypothetical protein EG68_08646 [Paragonimus skrjabini miyazakii]|uniref:Uncharacterized protein n=1 Tax=Paragonimus skrjabini miyazakii TaxID=59628 RepID=A0A8S9YVF2_9TREM|nr:hypothetical protein EG68_08646 [Paragonimus skrjabini miyazakii]
MFFISNVVVASHFSVQILKAPLHLIIRLGVHLRKITPLNIHFRKVSRFQRTHPDIPLGMLIPYIRAIRFNLMVIRRHLFLRLQTINHLSMLPRNREAARRSLCQGSLLMEVLDFLSSVHRQSRLPLQDTLQIRPNSLHKPATTCK